MPSPSAFRRAFGIAKGDAIALVDGGGGRKATVTACTCGHDVITPFERYEFPLAVVLTPPSGPPAVRGDGLLRALTAATRGERIVYSAFGSPYRCTIPAWRSTGKPATDAGRTFTARGVGIRARDIPSARQAADTSDSVSTADAAALRATGHRVIKSAWGRGKCATCGQTVGIGVYITQPAGGSGGWSHAACVLARRGGKVSATAAARADGDARTARAPSRSDVAAAAIAAAVAPARHAYATRSAARAATPPPTAQLAGTKRRRA